MRESETARPRPNFSDRLRRKVGATVVDNFFRVIAQAGRLHPHARPSKHHVEVIRDLPYLEDGSDDHLLDIYRPTFSKPPWPVVFYVHGGGFRILSKDTHWIMGLAFARQGYLVVNINYRLAPRHPFPAALEDAAAALAWTQRRARDYGGDLDRLVLAGESAGANLVASLAVAASYRRDEPAARVVWDANVRARAVFCACGILQVTEPERFLKKKQLPPWVYDRITEPNEAYLRGDTVPSLVNELADPLRVLEKGRAPDRPLPPFFAPCGTRDPLLDDTRRLKTALDALGVPCEARYYEGEPHAFHAMVFRKNARRCWRDGYDFLDKHLDMTTERRPY